MSSTCLPNFMQIRLFLKEWWIFKSWILDQILAFLVFENFYLENYRRQIKFIQSRSLLRNFCLFPLKIDFKIIINSLSDIIIVFQPGERLRLFRASSFLKKSWGRGTIISFSATYIREKLESLIPYCSQDILLQRKTTFDTSNIRICLELSLEC